MVVKFHLGNGNLLKQWGALAVPEQMWKNPGTKTLRVNYLLRYVQIVLISFFKIFGVHETC